MQIAFRLDKQVANLANWNPRPELHGEEKVPASDLSITFSASNDVLSMFDPQLKSAFYRAPHPGETDLVDQAADDLPAGYLPRLKFPYLKGALRIDTSLIGAEVTIEYGTGGKSNIVLSECDVDGFKFDLLDGGTVNVSLRIKCHPDEKQPDKLYKLIGREITISILPAGAGEADPFMGTN